MHLETCGAPAAGGEAGGRGGEGMGQARVPVTAVPDFVTLYVTVWPL